MGLFSSCAAWVSLRENLKILYSSCFQLMGLYFNLLVKWLNPLNAGGKKCETNSLNPAVTVSKLAHIFRKTTLLSRDIQVYSYQELSASVLCLFNLFQTFLPPKMKECPSYLSYDFTTAIVLFHTNKNKNLQPCWCQLTFSKYNRIYSLSCSHLLTKHNNEADVNNAISFTSTWSHSEE